MPGFTSGLPIAAGPLYTNAIMGQAPSAAEREHARKASSTILREDSIRVEQSDQFEKPSEPPSRPDSRSMHFDRTDQAPYSTAATAFHIDPARAPSGADDTMMTQASLLHLPRNNPNRELAFFLRTTGPDALHRRPTKIEDLPRQSGSGSRHALRFFKKGKRPVPPATPTAHERLEKPRDEGGLLSDIEEHPVPQGVEQKVSGSGKKYLALKVDSQEAEGDRKVSNDAPAISPSIVESRVSISFAESINSPEGLDRWFATLGKDQSLQRPPSPPEPSDRRQQPDERSRARTRDRSPSPVRPAASSPPTPDQGSATSIAESYFTEFTEQPAKTSVETARAVNNRAFHPPSSSLPPPKGPPPPGEEFPFKRPVPGPVVEIKHPTPRRFASQPILLQRASSIASSFYPRSMTESPGPPPPRSPLRLRRDSRTIENVIATQPSRKTTPKTAPSIKDVTDCNNEFSPIKATVTTDCTGPIKRPRSRGKGSKAYPAYPTSRKEREEKTRARKLRDKPTGSRSIDAAVTAPPSLRFRKARPHIQIPGFKPTPHATRASSSASSSESGQKMTEFTRTPIPAVPSEGTHISSGGDKTGYTPISPADSNLSGTGESSMGFSPAMLVAEEIPVQKARSQPKTTKILPKESKAYSPRPRSASLPRNAFNRRSHQAPAALLPTPTTRSPAAPSTTASTQAVPLSPPPIPASSLNRALPPTPPASGSEKSRKPKQPLHSSVKAPPIPPPPPPPQHFPRLPADPPKPARSEAHALALPQPNQTKKRTSTPPPLPQPPAAYQPPTLHARLEALEKQNALLSAALAAVLGTNIAPHAMLAPDANPLPEQQNTRTRPAATTCSQRPAGSSNYHVPSAWESRMARRSAATAGSRKAQHGPSSSVGSGLSGSGSALEMYMSVRRGSGRGIEEG